MYSKERLRMPPEPVGLKKQILNAREHFRSDLGTSNIDVDSLAVWLGNIIPKYLWNEWKVPLRAVGLTWPKFLKLMKYNTKYMIKWMDGRMDWEIFGQNIMESIDDLVDPHIEMLAEAAYKDSTAWSPTIEMQAKGAIPVRAGQMEQEKKWADLDEAAKNNFRAHAMKILETMGVRK